MNSNNFLEMSSETSHVQRNDPEQGLLQHVAPREHHMNEFTALASQNHLCKATNPQELAWTGNATSSSSPNFNMSAGFFDVSENAPGRSTHQGRIPDFQHQIPHTKERNAYSELLQLVAPSEDNMNQTTALTSHNYLLEATPHIRGYRGNVASSSNLYLEMPTGIAGGSGTTLAQRVINPYNYQGNRSDFDSTSTYANPHGFSTLPYHKNIEEISNYNPMYKNLLEGLDSSINQRSFTINGGTDLRKEVVQSDVNPASLKKKQRGGIGRKKTNIQFIEDNRTRSSTYSMRRKRLIDKTKELCEIWNTEVAVIVFSPAGRLFTYGNPSVGYVLKKYKSVDNPGLGAQKSQDSFTRRRDSFTRRRDTIFRKAKELCTLCGAKIAVIIFLSLENVFTFGDPSVKEVVDKYLEILDQDRARGLEVVLRKNPD